MAYTNPAKLFLTDHTITNLDDICAYTGFLRQKAGLSDDPPIDLNKIYHCFEIPPPKNVALPGQEGLTLFSGQTPQILINIDDKLTRRRFTEAHELIEILFHELPGDIRRDRLKETIFGSRKESICQSGAANLLMPHGSFKRHTASLGISFDTGRNLAEIYEVSLTASLYRITDLYPNQTAVILWRLKNKPVELGNKVPSQQLSFLSNPPATLPPPKLRVEWAYGEYKSVFIPPNKSIPEDSSVYRAWQYEQTTSAEELLPFGKGLVGYIENLPISFGGKKYVLSLLSTKK